MPGRHARAAVGVAQPAVRRRGRGRGHVRAALRRPAPLPAAAAQIRTVTRIAAIEAAAWDRLAPADNPFLRHAFLDALEASGSVSEQTGWQPFHLIVERPAASSPRRRSTSRAIPTASTCSTTAGPTAIAAPAAATTPSSRRRCRSHPCRGPGCWPRTTPHAHAGRRPQAATRQLGLSSLHVTFCTAAEAAALGAAGFLVRRGIQFTGRTMATRTSTAWLDASRAPSARWCARSARRWRAAGVTIEAVHGEAVDAPCSTSSFPSTSPPSTSAGATPISAAISSAALAAT